MALKYLGVFGAVAALVVDCVALAQPAARPCVELAQLPPPGLPQPAFREPAQLLAAVSDAC